MQRNRSTCLLLALLVSACGPGGGSNTNDSGVDPGAHKLTILNPPGRSIGLFPGEQTTLRVLYRDPIGDPVSGAQVDFTIDGEAGGATLGAFHSTTDRDGVAEMLLISGVENATFKVQVTAPHAIAVAFEVAVSDAGFTRLEVLSMYTGTRDATAFQTVSARLFFRGACSELDRSGDDSPHRERITDLGFGELLVFDNLPVDLDVAVAVRGADAQGFTLAWGCAEIASVQMVPGVALQLHLLAEDVWVSPAGSYEVDTDVVLADEAPLAMEDALAPLAALGACPYDPVQTLLDCLADAASPDGELDCTPTAADNLAVVLGELRGVGDVNDCRTSENPSGETSLEGLVWEAADATTLARFQALQDLADQSTDGLERFWITSELFIQPTGIGQQFVVQHRLSEVEFDIYAPGVVIDLALLGNLIIESPLLPAGYLPGEPTLLEIPAHNVTLQPLRVVRAAAVARFLTPVDLTHHPTDLLEAVLSGVSVGSGQDRLTGCDALDEVVCTALNNQAACPTGSCAQGLAVLADRMSQFWEDALESNEPDLALTTTVPLVDENGDLKADRLGGHAAAQWVMSLVLGGQTLTPQTASFTAVRAPPLQVPH